jgi:hypothetical protein
VTPTVKWLCKYLGQPLVIFLCALLALLLLFALSLLVPSFGDLLVLLLLLLALIGLLVLSLLLARLIARRCRKASADPKGKGSVGHRGARSRKIPSDTYRRPDPLIYSQGWLMARGLAMTWDNPDIQLEPISGVSSGPVSSNELEPSKGYRIRAQVWNGSTDSPAVNVLVRFYYLSFGIGASRKHIGDTLVNLPVKGAPGLPAVAEHSWQTPDEPGHYCIQVELVWPDDADPTNNLGQENVDVKALNSPTATFQVNVRNEAFVRRTLVLESDAYAIPPLLECPADDVPEEIPQDLPQESLGDGLRTVRPSRDKVPLGPTTVQLEARARHARSNFSLPTGWQVEFLPSERLQLGPQEERLVTVRVVAPDGFTGRAPINVNAFAAGELVGGVTLYVHD